MTNDKLTNAIGQLDEEILAEHFAYEKELKKKRVWHRMNWKTAVAIAACMAVLIGTMLISFGADESEFDLEPYTVYFVGDHIEGEPPRDADLTNVLYLENWEGTYKVVKYEDPDAPQTFTAEIFGNEYTLEYCYSEEVPVLYAESGCRNLHVYGNPDALEAVDRVCIKVNALTQQVVYWEDRRDCEKKNTLLESVGSMSSEYFELREKYGRACLEALIGQELLNQYVYIPCAGPNFHRYVAGTRALEYATVWVYEDGTPYYYRVFNPGYYEDVTEVVFNEEKAENAITEAIQKLYPGGAECITSSRELVKLTNGQLVYDYYALVQTADYGERTVCFIIPAE